MKITYDPKVDALSIIFRETTITTKHLAEGIAADYDAQGRLASRFLIPSSVLEMPRRSTMLCSRASAPRPRGNKR